MITTTLTKALVQYLMAVALPQKLGFLHLPEGSNPFVNSDKKSGRRTCLLSESGLKGFRAETGIELTEDDVLSCTTLGDFEKLIEAGSEKLSVEKLSRLILHLTETLGTIWNNLELVENLDEISDSGLVNPAYVWPYYAVDFRQS